MWLWTSLTSWLTPTALFIVVNIVIATIAVISRRYPPPPHGGPYLARPPLLHRVRSFNFSLHNSDQKHHPISDTGTDPNPTHLTRTPSVLDRLKSISLSSLYRSDSSTPMTEEKSQSQSLSPEPEQNHDHLINRRNSDTGSHTLTTKTSLQRRLKKSLSEKLTWVSLTAMATSRAEEEDGDTIERRRPATARVESGGEEIAEGDDEEVDAKADDFINKFKQQLKLQRLKSLIRYRDTMKGK